VRKRTTFEEVPLSVCDKNKKMKKRVASPGKWTYKSPSMGVPEKNKKKPPFGRLL